jgi:hypothetical protein
MMIGDNLSGESRLTKLLQSQPNVNNGTIYGGLAHVLQQALMGYESGKDSRSQQAATDAYVRGMTAQPWTNPDTGEVAPAGSAGGQAGAMAALQGQQNNPYARNLAMQLMMEQAQTQGAEQQWQNRFDAQNQAQDARFDKKLAAEKEMALYKASHPAAATTPSNVSEYEYFQKLAPDQQKQYLIMKRANPYLNLGDAFVQPDPTNPGQTMGQPIAVGTAPQTKIDPSSNRIISAPGVPSGPSAGWAASHGQPAQFAPQPPVVGGGQPALAPQAGAAFGNGVNIQNLPESPAAVEKEKLRQDNRARAGGTVIQDIGRAIDTIQNNPNMTTGAGAVLSHVPYTDAKAVDGYIESALSNVGLDTLQAMREASPTGGALGQVPIQQQKRLEQVLGSLDMTQASPILLDNLKRVQNIYLDIVYGTPEQIDGLIRAGKVDPDRGQELMQRHELSFDEFGRPRVAGQENNEQAAPANGGWSIQKVQ